MSPHIVDFCPLTKLNGSLSQLHSADDDAVAWLTSYGFGCTYKKCPLRWSVLVAVVSASERTMASSLLPPYLWPKQSKRRLDEGTGRSLYAQRPSRNCPTHQSQLSGLGATEVEIFGANSSLPGTEPVTSAWKCSALRTCADDVTIHSQKSQVTDGNSKVNGSRPNVCEFATYWTLSSAFPC